jgi:hypothetical protein
MHCSKFHLFSSPCLRLSHAAVIAAAFWAKNKKRRHHQMIMSQVLSSPSSATHALWPRPTSSLFPSECHPHPQTDSGFNHQLQNHRAWQEVSHS